MSVLHLAFVLLLARSQGDAALGKALREDLKDRAQSRADAVDSIKIDDRELRRLRRNLPPDIAYVRKEIPVRDNGFYILKAAWPGDTMFDGYKWDRSLAKGDKTKAREFLVEAKRFARPFGTLEAVASGGRFQLPIATNTTPMSANTHHNALAVGYRKVIRAHEILGDWAECARMGGNLLRVGRRIEAGGANGMYMPWISTPLTLGLGNARTLATHKDVTIEQLQNLEDQIPTEEELVKDWQTIGRVEFVYGAIPRILRARSILRGETPDSMGFGLEKTGLIGKARFDTSGTMRLAVSVQRTAQANIGKVGPGGSVPELDQFVNSLPGHELTDKKFDAKLAAMKNGFGMLTASALGQEAAVWRTEAKEVMNRASATRAFIELVIYYRRHHYVPTRLAQLPNRTHARHWGLNVETGRPFIYSADRIQIFINQEDCDRGDRLADYKTYRLRA